VYINDLPMILEPNNIPVLFADDASVLISHANPIHFNEFHNYFISFVTVQTIQCGSRQCSIRCCSN
jgi:hypothetical protein